jgi:hypothetical protein
MKLKQKALPYRYVLPRDLQTVKYVAYMQGVLNAFDAKAQCFDDSRPGYRELAATFAQDQMLASSEQGRQGTNNPEAFREVFVEICAQVHTVASVLFDQQIDMYEIMRRASEERRREIALKMALQNTAVLEKWKPGETLQFDA